MVSVTIKNIPEHLLERVRARAAADKQSMTKEIVYLLEAALAGSSEEGRERRLQEAKIQQEAEIQVEIWSRLAGRWDSELTAEDEIEAIYKSRTKGREIDL